MRVRYQRSFVHPACNGLASWLSHGYDGLPMRESVGLSVRTASEISVWGWLSFGALRAALGCSCCTDLDRRRSAVDHFDDAMNNPEIDASMW